MNTDVVFSTNPFSRSFACFVVCCFFVSVFFLRYWKFPALICKFLKIIAKQQNNDILSFRK
ncbi:MAG: hypothetical protein DRP83_09360 [Planctomycetota bacterium]|nr:MAG: hypothetical protein DRP83_09360 [Planctomycetota bacterium]